MNKKPAYCPEWFDLDNYNICEKYTRQEWAKAISLRQCGLYNNIQEDLSNGINKDFLINTLIFFSQNNDRVNGDTFFDFSAIYELDFTSFIELYSSIKNKSPETIKKIDSMFHHRLDGNEENTSSHPFKDWKDVDLNNLFGKDFNLDTPLSHIFPVEQKFITVDLSNNDEKIIEDFQIFLRSERMKENNQNKHNRKRDRSIEMLHEFNILPYIDLYLWCLISGRDLTQFQMATILFPNEHDIDIKDRLRAVTKPKAMELLDSKIDLIV